MPTPESERMHRDRGPSVAVTHSSRVLFPADGITKGDLVRYYAEVSDALLPYTIQRPLTLQRWPGGIDGFSFFEKQVPPGAPPWIPTTRLHASGRRKEIDYPLCNDVASLLWFANLAAITLHVWMSRLGSLDEPDFLLFDLDPFTGATVSSLAQVALVLRDELGAIGLPSQVKSTGGRGLHVLVPLAPGHSYEEARAFEEVVAERLRELLPSIVTLERSKAKRPHGSIYFDWAQLAKGKTYVPPFVVRARPGAPVSTPLPWSEIAALRSSRSSAPTAEAFVSWNISSVPRLLRDHGDPWRSATIPPQRLVPAIERARTSWARIFPA